MSVVLCVMRRLVTPVLFRRSKLSETSDSRRGVSRLLGVLLLQLNEDIMHTVLLTAVILRTVASKNACVYTIRPAVLELMDKAVRKNEVIF